MCYDIISDKLKDRIRIFRGNSTESQSWKTLIERIASYVDFCREVNGMEQEDIVGSFGVKAANMAALKREWIDGKLRFMLGQLESLCGGKYLPYLKI